MRLDFELAAVLRPELEKIEAVLLSIAISVVDRNRGHPVA